MKKNGYTTLEILSVIGVLGIFTIVILSTTSYAYKDRSGIYFNQIEEMAETQAELYGKTLKNLEEEGSLVITLGDLVEKGYYVADDVDGNVVDPRNSKNTLNGLKIKLIYKEDGSINADVIEE